MTVTPMVETQFLMLPSSRTPEGDRIRCHLCGEISFMEPSRPPGDVPCPSCGALVWVGSPINEEIARVKFSLRQFVRETHRLAERATSREELGDHLVVGLRDCLEAYGATLWICSRRHWWSRRVAVRASCSCGQAAPTSEFAERLANNASHQSAMDEHESVLHLGAPIETAGRKVGVIEVLQRPQNSAAAKRGYLIMINQMAQIVGSSRAFLETTN